MDLVRKKDFLVVIHRPNKRKVIRSFQGTEWQLRWLAENWAPNSSSGFLEISRNNCLKRVEFEMRIVDYVISGFLIQGQLTERVDISRLRLKRVEGTLTIIENIQNIANGYFPRAMGDIPVATKLTINKQWDSKIVNANKSSTTVKILEDLLSLLNNPDSFPDATVKCGTSEIKVHKCILTVRSPIFASMFRNPMQEGLSGTIEIVDMAPDVVQAMLKYIYSGKTDHLNEALAKDLLYATDKYQIEELKTICVDIIIASMVVSNVVDCLVLGDLYDERLKKYAKEFICKCKKFSEIGLEQWKSVQVERKDLAIEVLMSVVEYVQEIL